MKRLFVLTAIAAVFAVVATSCVTSRGGGHCEAYGSTDQVERTDLASK